MSTRKAWESRQVLSAREEHFHVWTKKIGNYVSRVFPNVVTAETVAIGVPELGVETSAEIDAQLFVVLSALTDGESFDVVMSAGGDHGFESWRKLRGRWDPYSAGRARSLLREILSPTRAKLFELMCAIEKMEDLVRRHSSRRDAQGNAHNLAEDICISSLEALLPDDLEKHVQLNRARLTSYGVLREEIKTYCECRGHANARDTKQKGSSHSGRDDPVNIGAFGNGKGKQGKGKHGKGKGKGKQGQQGQHGQDKDKNKDKSKDYIECWNCGKRGLYSKDCWSKKNTNKGGKHKPKNADAHNLDSKPSIVEPEVEIDEFNMSYLDVDALQQQESEMMPGSEWIKIGVDTGAGKTAWSQSITYGTTIPGHSDLNFRTATGELVKGGKRMHVLWIATIGDQISEFEVFKHRCATRYCLLESTQRWVESLCSMVKNVTLSTKFRMLRRKLIGWIQKELRDSQYRGCTVAYKGNNVYNIYMKPRENKIDAMPLSGDSESGDIFLFFIFFNCFSFFSFFFFSFIFLPTLYAVESVLPY